MACVLEKGMHMEMHTRYRSRATSGRQLCVFGLYVPVNLAIVRRGWYRRDVCGYRFPVLLWYAGSTSTICRTGLIVSPIVGLAYLPTPCPTVSGFECVVLAAGICLGSGTIERERCKLAAHTILTDHTTATAAVGFVGSHSCRSARPVSHLRHSTIYGADATTAAATITPTISTAAVSSIATIAAATATAVISAATTANNSSNLRGTVIQVCRSFRASAVYTNTASIHGTGSAKFSETSRRSHRDCLHVSRHAHGEHKCKRSSSCTRADIAHG